jgi:hypothetical protein
MPIIILLANTQLLLINPTSLHRQVRSHLQFLIIYTRCVRYYLILYLPSAHLFSTIMWPIASFSNRVQSFVDQVLVLEPPAPKVRLRPPKIAIIGAGVTGVTAAAHCVGHAFEPTIFEAGSRSGLGGIWSVSS